MMTLAMDKQAGMTDYMWELLFGKLGLFFLICLRYVTNVQTDILTGSVAEYTQIFNETVEESMNKSYGILRRLPNIEIED